MNCDQSLEWGDFFASWCFIYKQKEFTVYSVDPKCGKDKSPIHRDTDKLAGCGEQRRIC